MPNNQVYWREIEGKHLINYRITAVVTPLVVLTVPLQEMKSETNGTFLDWTIASTVAWGVIAFLYFLADITIFRNRNNRKYPVSVAICFGAVLGFAKGFVTAFTAINMSLVTRDETKLLYFRSVTGLFIGAMTVPLFAFLLAAISDYASERKKLIEDYLLLEEQIRGESETLDELKSKLSTKVDENLTKSLLKAQMKIKTGKEAVGQWQEIADTLRSAAEETIRPLSHAMWNVRRKEMQLTTFEFLKFAIQNIKFRPVVVLPLYIVTTLMALQELIKQKFKHVLTLVLIAVGGIYFVLTELIYEATSYQTTFWDLGESVWLIILVLVTGIADSALRTQIFQITTLKGLIAKKRIELIANGRELDRMGREMARYLHGTIQSKLMAAAMAVEIAGRKNDKKQLDIEIDKALQTLQMPTQEYLDARISDLNDGLDELAQKWDGIIKIDFNKIVTEVFSLSETITILDIANEGILNAYRHGAATSAQLHLKRLKNNMIKLEISDNGIGVQAIKPGLGSQYFNSLTSNWSLENKKTSKGAVLTIEF
jgi:signal transduction histidine kinase